MNQRQLAALLEPLDTADLHAVAARRTITPQPDGTLLVAILAVDR